MFSVIFEVHPKDGLMEAYLELAKELKPIIETIDGFIDNERFESRLRPGWVLSHSTWRDEKSVIRWRTQARHHLTQEKGRFKVFSDYLLRVGEITADEHPPNGLDVIEQRFDTTETGRAKACTLTEISPKAGAVLPEDAEHVLKGLSLDPALPSLVEHDVFDSIYNPGKLMVIGCWASSSDAEQFRPASMPEVGSLRHRAVRVIREYGMFDRRETPQYYPEVEQGSR